MTSAAPLRFTDLTPPPPVDPASDPYAAHLLELIERADDLSSWSDELALAAPSWPDSYHLHPARANVLRTVPISADATVLEIGARAGGLTRHLGENAGAVDALELDPAFAAVAAARCAGLDSVQVRVGWIDSVPDQPAYDLVVAIDVLAELEAQGTTLETFVARCRSLLLPGGVLVLAVDNSVGVSALLGGQTPRLPVPDGRSASLAPSDVVSAVLAAGLDLELLSAFPDHRHTQLLFSPARLAALDQTLLAELPKFAAPPTAPTFVEADAQQQRWMSMVADGHSEGHANSIVVLAGTAVPAPDDAATFWSIGRCAAQSACNRVRMEGDGPVVVRTRAFPRAPEPHTPLRLHPHTEPVVHGRSVTRLLAHETSVAGAQDLLVRWREFVTSWPADHPDVAAVPWDLIPRNVMVLTDGSMYAIDQEWHLDGADAKLVLARGLFWLAEELLAAPSHPTWLIPGTVATVADFLKHLSGAPLGAFWLDDFIADEADQAAYVAPMSPRHSHAFQARKNRGALMALSQSGDDHPLSTPPDASPDGGASAALHAAIASLTEENETLRQQVRALELEGRHVALVHRDHVLGINAELETIRERWGIAQRSMRRARAKSAQLQKDLTAMRQSTTWRVGRRVVAPMARLRGSSKS